MKYRKKLFAHHDLYNTTGTDSLFFRAVVENLQFHINNCPEYSLLLQKQGFYLSSLSSTNDLYKIPPLPTLFLKTHNMHSLPYEKMLFKATSSGTKGMPSLVEIDFSTSIAALRMVWRTFTYYGLFSIHPTNYIVLGYEPSKHNQMGAAQTAYATTLAAPALHREYALKDMGGSYELNQNGIIATLLRYEQQGFPVRFIGFPAYFMFLLEALKKQGIKLSLHPKSKVFLAGGWKNFFQEKTDKLRLYAMAEDILSIKEHNCKDFFGAVEHPITYCDCKNHHFHVPVYSRIILRDVDTLKPVGFETPGIMNLITPLVGSMPLTSVMTDDIAVMHPGESCGCGISSPWFEILGRAGLKDIKTCAAGATELLKGVSL